MYPFPRPARCCARILHRLQGGEKSGGFTLVEMLVVIAIIALLASLLLPSIQAARRSALSAKCQANMRSVGQAMILFAGEHDGRLPWCEFVSGQNVNQAYVSWDDQLSEYDGRDKLTTAERNATFLRASSAQGVKAASIYKCPAETRFDSNTAVGDILMRSFCIPRLGNQNWDRWRGGDGFPAGVFRPPAAGMPQGWTARLSQVPSPQTTILLAEVRGNQTRLGSVNGIVVDRPFPYGDASSQIHVSNPVMQALHHPRWNYLFCDGHAESLDPRDTLNSKLAWYTGMWSRQPDD